MWVDEPEPGRVLTGSDQLASAVSSFIVTPRAGLPRADPDVLAGRRGVGGFFKRLFAPRVLRRIDAHKCERLDRYARAAG